jgi:hypothetical protein
MNELERFIAAKHEPGTEDANDVVTSPFKQGLRAVEHVAQRKRLGCFYGSPGTGKTFTILTACARLAITPFYVPIAKGSSGKQVEYEILQRVNPEKADYRLARPLMRKHIKEGLSGQPSLLVLDEFDVMESDGADVLRYLLEQKVAGYILVGAKADEVVRRYPALDSRCSRWVPFGRIPEAALLETLAAYHPLLAATKPEVLRKVDGEWAEGNFRRWAMLLEAGLRLPAGERVHGLSYEGFKKAYLLIGDHPKQVAA